jgi:hypothetical protein
MWHLQQSALLVSAFLLGGFADAAKLTSDKECILGCSSCDEEEGYGWIYDGGWVSPLMVRRRIHTSITVLLTMCAKSLYIFSRLSL